MMVALAVKTRKSYPLTELVDDMSRQMCIGIDKQRLMTSLGEHVTTFQHITEDGVMKETVWVIP